jgi:cysteine synthase
MQSRAGLHRFAKAISCAFMPTTATTLDLIGNTPLVLLRGPSAEAGCEIYGKCEYVNPGASVKDRAALFIVRDAEAQGLLKPGGTIVEGTAGNTGIGLALVGNALGYKTIIVMPETQSQEKKDTLRALGAELVLVPAAPYANPGHFVHTSRRIAEETENAIWANQFDNIANRQAHVETTAPEIWEQTGGKVDGFVSSVGSGGTLAGVAMGLRERKADVAIAIADPMGAALYSWYSAGELKAEGSSITEGIGQGRVTANLEGLDVDYAYQIPDEEALEQVFDLTEHEGLCMGGSTGVNIAGAIRLARDLGPGHTIVTVLCDHGSRYQSKLFNKDFLAERGLPIPAWL